MAVVTISRQFGAGALLLGDKLCEKTGFRMVDHNIINEVLSKEKISTNWVEALEKESASNALYLLSSIVSQVIFYKTPGIPDEEVERKRYLNILNNIMNEMGNKGGFVIIGRGAQFFLKDHPKAIHVLLICEYEKRVRTVAETFNISSAKAKELIKIKEKQRANLAANLYKENIDDTSHYHIVLNTGRVSLEWAVDIVLDMLEKQIKKEEKRI